MLTRLLSCLCLSLSLTGPAIAQSNLGLARFETDLTAGTLGNRTHLSGRISGDFVVGPAHGVQIDGLLRSYPDGVLGQIDAHLYLMPRPDRKYGVFASLADVDGREATIGMIGVEGVFALTGRTTVEAQAGIGLAQSNKANRGKPVDFVSVRAGLHHRIGKTTTVFAEAYIAEISESHFKAIPYGAKLGAVWQAPDQPFRVRAAIGLDGLSGRDGRKTEAVAEIGIVWTFGSPHRTPRSVAGHGFSSPRPLDALLRRGLF